MPPCPQIKATSTHSDTLVLNESFSSQTGLLLRREKGTVQESTQRTQLKENRIQLVRTDHQSQQSQDEWRLIGYMKNVGGGGVYDIPFTP